ncbi:methylated-DNA--[protein]-cysteine S-methyltransferase [Methanothermobacter marburgensis]|nr:methylated-DNA--[protein]-cysteine S-methyltransferase [Methanothermobacter marburgensis]
MYMLRHSLACIGLKCAGGRVQRVFFIRGRDVGVNVSPTDSGCESISGVLDSLNRFLDGEDVPFDPAVLDFRVCTGYQRGVLRVVMGIPRGSTMTYAEVAGAAGGGPRSVAGALARNPFPLIIPCHRVIRSDGKPGGYQGGVDLKVRLLEMEGAHFKI